MGVQERRQAAWAGDRKQTTLWRITNRDQDAETVHGTQKPVEFMKRPIENNSNLGQVVYEPFSGSGSTIIAAEMTGRCANAIELNPAYVDVAILRWQAFHRQGGGAGKRRQIVRRGETKRAGRGGRVWWRPVSRQESRGWTASRGLGHPVNAAAIGNLFGPDGAVHRLADGCGNPGSRGVWQPAGLRDNFGDRGALRSGEQGEHLLDRLGRPAVRLPASERRRIGGRLRLRLACLRRPYPTPFGAGADFKG